MFKACGIISLRAKRLVDMICKSPTWVRANLILMIGAEGTGTYAVVRDEVCPYEISPLELPFPLWRKEKVRHDRSLKSFLKGHPQLNYLYS